MDLQDNTVNKIIKEIILGIILLITFFLIKKIGISGKELNVIAKVMYSVGSVVLLTKMPSFVACYILENTRRNIFWKLYIFIEGIVVFLYILLLDLFHNGYLWLEIVTFILCSIWVLMDMNTVSCMKKVNEINNEIECNVKQHFENVEDFKITMNELLEKKYKLLKELEPYVKETLFRDPLKNVRRDIYFPDIDRYLETIPRYKGKKEDLKGLGGLTYGRCEVARLQYSSENYKKNLLQEWQSLNTELNLYQKNVDALETKISLVKQSGKEIDTLEDFGFNSSKFKMIQQNEILNVKGCDKDFKRINDLHKKINKIRRKHKYEIN